MTAVTINLASRAAFPNVSETPTAKVWTKASWGDNWTERPDFIPTESTWTVGSTLATSSLYHPYGRVRFPNQSQHANVPKVTSRGYFVMIGWECDDGDPLYWLGYAESPINSSEIPARDGIPVSGVQTIPCIGMIGLLRQNWITTTVHEDPAGPTNDPKRAHGGSIFNRDGNPNRSSTKQSLNGGHSAYVFANPSDDGEFWSSRDVIEHLIAFHLPTPTQQFGTCLLYTSPSPRDLSTSRMPSSA